MKVGEHSETEKYNKYLNFLIKYSNEKEVLSKEILNYFQPTKDMTFLDIGAGEGSITTNIASLVKETTAIESNHGLANQLRQNSIKVIEADYQSIDLDKKFDLVLASHVIYYFESVNWLSMVGKMYRGLNEGGKLCVVFFANSGGFYELFSEHYSEERIKAYKRALGFLDEIKNTGIELNVKKVESMFDMPEDVALDVFSFFSGCNNKERLKEFFKKYNNNGQVNLPADHNLVMIEKS
jgi:ubiquinone/menaquinone biosynthesis C-methylase UbiE